MHNLSLDIWDVYEIWFLASGWKCQWSNVIDSQKGA